MTASSDVPNIDWHKLPLTNRAGLPLWTAVVASTDAPLVDTGLRYCVRHHGFVDADQKVCDFARIDDEGAECASRPLLYVAEGAVS